MKGSSAILKHTSQFVFVNSAERKGADEHDSDDYRPWALRMRSSPIANRIAPPSTIG
jgi:hypothetical protein